MKVSDLYLARTLADELREKQALIDTVEKADHEVMNKTMHVAVHGKYLDNAVMIACQQPIINELTKQVVEIKAQLKRIGVDA